MIFSFCIGNTQKKNNVPKLGFLKGQFFFLLVSVGVGVGVGVDVISEEEIKGRVGELLVITPPYFSSR